MQQYLIQDCAYEMSYFKNSELAYTYHVSDRTVRNWVALAKEGKIPLELEIIDDKAYVARTSGNIKAIESHVAKNKTRRPRAALKVIAPQRKFYTLFTQSQIYDIVRNLEMHHEIPRQYNYFDGGASEWDEYARRLATEESPNLLNRTVNLIAENQTYIDSRLEKYARINVVDIGVGNAQPARQLLQHLLDQGKLGRYIAIDISGEMLDIAHQNVKEWFGGKVVFEPYQIDITHERFANILAEDYLSQEKRESANLVLFLGGTPFNFRNPNDAFRTINESMNPNDLLIYSDKLETSDMSPEWYNFDAKPGKQELTQRHRLVFDLLNIDDSFYDVEMGYDPVKRQRYTRARLTVAVCIKFEFEEGERIIEFEKGETILLWRSWQMNANSITEQLERNGFYTLHTSQTEDREYILAAFQVRQD